MKVKESDIDLNSGVIYIPHPKEKRPKQIELVNEDLQLLKEISRGMPWMYFFIHEPGVSGAIDGDRFGEKIFYKWWKRACEKIGVSGVDLYGGTKHSAVTDALNQYTPEEIRRFGTKHATNKAFDRYLYVDMEYFRRFYPSLVEIG
ncbi:MAG: hypothetical protein ABIL58_23105 [Pseudomonadota bacterium]